MRILFICATLLLTNCTNVVVKDSEWCADAGKLGASCWHTLNDKSRDIKKEDWDKERFGEVCATPQAFADMQAVIEIFCQNTGQCTEEAQTTVNRFMKHLKEKTDLKKTLGVK